MFQLLDFTESRLTSVTNRIEKHGDEDCPAVTLRVEITAANTLLDTIDPTLRHALYKAVPDQEELPGIEPATPVLRCNSFDKLALTTAHEGWTLHLDDGADESQPMVFGGMKVDRFTVDAKQGGSIVLGLRLGTSDVDAEKLGKLGMLNGQSIWIKLLKPEAKAAAIDGTTGHPGAGGGEPDAGDLFADEHGPDDDADTEGGDADVELDGDDEGAPQDLEDRLDNAMAGEQPAEPERGENWPFGTNSGADGTNEGNGETDGADFEAGAAAAIAKAGVKPARRGRKAAVGAVE